MDAMASASADTPRKSEVQFRLENRLSLRSRRDLCPLSEYRSETQRISPRGLQARLGDGNASAHRRVVAKLQKICATSSGRKYNQGRQQSMRIGNRVVALAWANLGHCSRCMGTAFRFAAAAWLVAFVILTFLQQPVAANLLMIVAGLMTMLWVGHLLAYATKVTISTARASREGTGAGTGQQPSTRSRRELFPVFARTLGFATLVTSLPTLANAQTQTPCGPFTCTQGGPFNQCCCCSPAGGCNCVANPPNQQGLVRSCIELCRHSP